MVVDYTLCRRKAWLSWPSAQLQPNITVSRSPMVRCLSVIQLCINLVIAVEIKRTNQECMSYSLY